MCGIAGAIGLGAGEGRDVLGRMLATLVHRGPDAEGIVAGAGWAIGARRLAILDLVTGDQPVENEAGDVHAVLNGEIYNYLELRADLLARGHRLRSSGDTEVLAHLWEDLGPAMLERLRGMFALAVVDERSGTLFLARDRLGKKPLYWAREAGGVRFGSELKALRAAVKTSAGLDRDALASFLTLGFVPEGQCVLAGVEKLPPGHWLSVDLARGSVEQRRWWRLSDDVDESMTSERAACESLAALRSAVGVRLRSDVPLAIFLSGGIDSGLVATLAAEAGGRARALTVRFAGGPDETRLAALTAARAGLELTRLEVDAAAGAALLPELAGVFDEPLADSSAIPTVLIARAAARHAKVVLNGDGGDEAFGGYRRFLLARALELPGAARWRRPLAAGMRALGGRRWLSGRGDRIAAALVEPGREYLAWGPVKLTPAEAAALLGQAPASSPVLEGCSGGASGDGAVARMRRLELELFLPGDLLVKMDRATMSASIEARSPLLDHEVVEIAARIPPRLLLAGWRTKAVLRRAGRALLPPEVLRAPKRGFEAPLAQWLDGAWAEEVKSLLEDPTAAIRGVLSASALPSWRQWRHLPDRTRAARAVYTLLTLEHWLRRWS